MKRPLSFVDGIGVGIGGLMLMPLLWWMVMRPSYIEMYKQMGPGVRPPSLTIATFHPMWGYGLPLLLGVGLGVAIWLRPTRWLIPAIGGTALVMSIFTIYGAYLPIWSLAGNIR